MSWLKKISQSSFHGEYSITLFLIGGRLIIDKKEHHEDMLIKTLGVPYDIAYIIKFAFPRGRIAFFRQGNYVEISPQLSPYRRTIEDLLGGQDASWSLDENHYEVWDKIKIIEKLREMVGYNFITPETVTNCSFVRKYLPEIYNAFLEE